MFEKGQSGNSKGRPKGIVDKRHAMRALLTPHAPALVDKAVELALAGDATALRLCLDRLMPVLKATSHSQLTALSGSFSERGEAVFYEMVGGGVDLSDGAGLISSLSHLAKIHEHTELEQRLSELEKQVAK